MLKKILLVFFGFAIRFVVPVGVLTDWKIYKLFTEPAAGYSLLGLIMFGVMFFFLNKTLDGMLEDKPKTHIGVFLFKEVKAIIWTAIAVGTFIFVGNFSTMLWAIAGVFGLCYIVSEYLFYEYYMLTKESSKYNGVK